MKKILITRARAQADEFAEKLRTAGFEPIYFPVIEIQPVRNNIALERTLSKLDCYEWIVFTSVNAVEVVVEQFPLLDWKAAKVAAIGPKTAKALEARGIQVDFIPQEYIAEAILPGLGDLVGKWVLLPRAEIARHELPEAICNAGGVPHEITVYKTVPAQPSIEALDVLRFGVDVITLTSQSTVQNFIAIATQNGLDPMHLPGNPIFACIGPITEQAAKDAGLTNILVAEEYTTDGLIATLKHLEVP
ncbi:MAG: uroporphyrinogen-III synthase [Anaerolineales bacterium]